MNIRCFSLSNESIMSYIIINKKSFIVKSKVKCKTIKVISAQQFNALISTKKSLSKFFKGVKKKISLKANPSLCHSFTHSRDV